MKYTGKTISQFKKIGDSVWACAYKPNSSKEGKALHQAPVKGQFVMGDTKARHEKNMERYANSYAKGLAEPWAYFVPYKKNGELAWSKAVMLSSRSYADTYEECVEMYNAKLEACIDWHKESIAEIEALKITL